MFLLRKIKLLRFIWNSLGICVLFYYKLYGPKIEIILKFQSIQKKKKQELVKLPALRKSDPEELIYGSITFSKTQGESLTSFSVHTTCEGQISGKTQCMGFIWQVLCTKQEFSSQNGFSGSTIFYMYIYA